MLSTNKQFSNLGCKHVYRMTFTVKVSLDLKVPMILKEWSINHLTTDFLKNQAPGRNPLKPYTYAMRIQQCKPIFVISSNSSQFVPCPSLTLWRSAGTLHSGRLKAWSKEEDETKQSPKRDF